MRELINTAIPETPSDSQTIEKKSAVKNGIESLSDWLETKGTDILPESADNEQQAHGGSPVADFNNSSVFRPVHHCGEMGTRSIRGEAHPKQPHAAWNRFCSRYSSTTVL